MIISHRHRFIFFKTPKTAGTSIEVFLSSRCGDGDIVTPIIPPEAGHVPRNHQGFFNHIPARVVRGLVTEEIWNGYFKFCVERNPWDKTLSHYHMWNFRAGGTATFDQFLAAGELPFGRPIYTDGSGEKILADRILRYENLAEELGDVFRQLGISYSGDLGVRAKSTYRADRRPYQRVYTTPQRDFVERVFAWEIAQHGYRF